MTTLNSLAMKQLVTGMAMVNAAAEELVYAKPSVSKHVHGKSVPAKRWAKTKSRRKLQARSRKANRR